MIVVSTVIMLDTIQNYNFHHKTVSRVNCILATSFFWINVSSFFLIASNVILFMDNAVIVVGLGAFFFVLLQLNTISFTANVRIKSITQKAQRD